MNNLRDGWEAQAAQWIKWARAPGHDSYWRFHRDQFLHLLPPPGRQTLDIGCGEGRLARDLKELGHRMVAVDSSPSLVAAAREFDPSMDVRLADAADLPLDDACADLAVAFMSLQDINGMPTTIAEAARVLEPGGRFCLAIVHPINSAGSFEEAAADAHFVIKGDYLHAFHCADTVGRAGLTMTFNSQHRPLEDYFMALERVGFLIEALREPSLPEHAIVKGTGRRWQRIPYFLHLRALRPQESPAAASTTLSSRCPKRVKWRNTRCEQMSSAVAQLTDIQRLLGQVRSVPFPEVALTQHRLGLSPSPLPHLRRAHRDRRPADRPDGDRY